jgi:hypothetical protein
MSPDRGHPEAKTENFSWEREMHLYLAFTLWYDNTIETPKVQ